MPDNDYDEQIMVMVRSALESEDDQVMAKVGVAIQALGHPPSRPELADIIATEIQNHVAERQARLDAFKTQLAKDGAEWLALPPKERLRRICADQDKPRLVSHILDLHDRVLELEARLAFQETAVGVLRRENAQLWAQAAGAGC